MGACTPVKKEDYRNPMIRRRIILAIGLFLLFTLFAGAAGAEEPVPASPTDLDCGHVHTKTTIYFFDSPSYKPMNALFHRVSGPATVETVCRDCGALLKSEVADSAKEIRRHSFKKGACVLCGYRQDAEAEDQFPDEPGEMTLVVREKSAGEGLLTLTLTSGDLYELDNSGVVTLLVRGETGDAAIALPVTEAMIRTEEAKADLALHFAEREDGSFFIGIFLVPKDGEATKPDAEGVTLRFYRQTGPGTRASLAPAGTDTLVEAEAAPNEKGYWSVAYVGEGTYFLLQ